MSVQQAPGPHSPVNPSTALARAILAELIHQGVREVVLAPGSRSAPLAFAALRLAESGQVRLHLRVDERSAGFLALGLAKASGEPVAVMCTSGTAVANLAPAVVEASYSAVPLVVVTADRPPEARGVAAPQTIDQIQFFGDNVRFFTDLTGPRRATEPELEEAQRGARAAVGQAVAAAVGVPRGRSPVQPVTAMAHAGPVHLNVGFRLPLVPEDAADPDPDPQGSPPRSRRPPLSGCITSDLDELIGDVPQRGVLLVGDLPCTSLREQHQWLSALAEGCGWPIIAEPSANLHDAPTTLGHGVLLAGSEGFLDAHPPELVVTAGLFGLSRPTLELVRRSGRHVALELPNVGREVCDPLRTADQVLSGIPLAPAGHEVDPTWLAAWRAADSAAGEVVAAELASSAGIARGSVVAAEGAPPAKVLTGSAVAAEVWRSAPSDGLLLVAASWPVRQVEAFGGRRAGLRVVGNRGANGIDGLVSTAWGAALAHQRPDDPGGPGGPVIALLGDLAFLHDHNGLLVGPDEPRPALVIVVIDNDGGGIFHQLEQGGARYADSFERLFGTPLGRDLVAIAEAAGLPTQRVHDVAGLRAALADALAAGGPQVVVSHAPDRVGEAALMDRIRRRVSQALATR